MYLAKTPKILQGLFPSLTWSLPTDEQVIYFSFDDGPIPEATPWVLDLLAEYSAKASFFCVGQNVETYPHLFERILEEEHTVGNHSHTHLSGWQNSRKVYLADIDQAANVVKSNLYRPPYGRMTPSQIRAIKRKYNIIMWDILSGDFDPKLNVKQCYHNVYDNVSRGSIVVFHDSLKSISKLKKFLPGLLADLSADGYKFKAIPYKAFSLGKATY